VLWRALGREGTHRPSPGWPRFLSRTALASLAMVGFLLWARHEVGAWSALAPAWRVIHLAWIVAGSAAIYAVALLAMGMRPRHLREE
jgi:putative peptidoglycan lipid II flippase